MDEESNGQLCYPVRMDHLPEIFRGKAQTELHETPETREIELSKLRGFLSADKLTSGIKFEEDFLHQFLRHSKYNSLKAFQYLQKYLYFRRNYSRMFRSIPDEDFKSNPLSQFFVVLPYRCPDGCVLFLAELGKWVPKDFPLEYFEIGFLSSFLQPLRCPMTQICGFKVIYDFKDTAKDLRYASPQNILRAYSAAFGCIPGRYKQVHCINKSAAFVIAWSLLKHVLSEKMRKRFFVHSKPEDLLNHFPRSVIPTQYGGSLSNYYDSELMQNINKDHRYSSEEGQPNHF